MKLSTQIATHTPAEHETTRLKIALEMKDDPSIKVKVESIVGEKEAQIRFPEAYQK
jgi:hypothetical protein